MRPNVVAALSVLDANNGEIWAKLDAGTEEHYRRINRTHVPLAQILDNIRQTARVRPIVLQSMFLCWHDQPPTAAEIDAYIARVTELRDAGAQFKLVQVYTIARHTAEAAATPLEPEALAAIAARVRELGLNVEVFE
jgi:hypothetical protein